MKVGIYDVYEGIEMPHQKIYNQILSFNEIKFIFLNISEDDFWLKLKDIDILMYKWQNNDNHHLLSNILRPILESLNIKFFPNPETSWHYDDKIKQYFLMLTHEMEPVPTHIFFHKEKAFEFINTNAFPIIAKLKKGASSSNVLMIKNKKQAKKYINKAFSATGFNPNYFGSLKHLFKTLDSNPHALLIYNLKRLKRYIEGRDGAYWERHKNYVLFQEFLPGNEYDTRVTTVGNRVHAFRRFVRKNDFRASGGTTWDIDPQKIDRRMLRMALDFSKRMNFQTMAYDFIYDKNNNPKIVEISYLFGQPGFPDFMNGYWDENLNWIEGRFWPQHFELIDALGIPDLKCPQIEVPKEWIKNMMV